MSRYSDATVYIEDCWMNYDGPTMLMTADGYGLIRYGKSKCQQ